METEQEGALFETTVWALEAGIGPPAADPITGNCGNFNHTHKVKVHQ